MNNYGFNPSVGILFIQAHNIFFQCGCLLLFQSLGRDSVHSSPIGLRGSRVDPSLFQSLGRDSVHSSIALALDELPEGEVSIPRSGFCSFKLVWTGQ